MLLEEEKCWSGARTSLGDPSDLGVSWGTCGLSFPLAK